MNKRIEELAVSSVIYDSEEKLTGNDVGYVVKKHFGIDNN